jgi:hypothetical protein
VSPEEMFAREEHLAVQRTSLVRLRDGATGPELFIRLGRDDYVIPVGIGTLTLLAEYANAYIARQIRRALIEEASDGGRS